VQKLISDFFRQRVLCRVCPRLQVNDRHALLAEYQQIDGSPEAVAVVEKLLLCNNGTAAADTRSNRGG